MCHTPESPKLGAVGPPHYGSGSGVIYERPQTVFRGSQQLTAELKQKKAGFEKQKNPDCILCSRNVLEPVNSRESYY